MHKCAIAISIFSSFAHYRCFVASRLNFGRDEVRPLSLARAASSPLALYGPISTKAIYFVYLVFMSANPSWTPAVYHSLASSSGLALGLFSCGALPFWLGAFSFLGASMYEYSSWRGTMALAALLFVGAVLYGSDCNIVALARSWLVGKYQCPFRDITCLITALWVWDTVVEKGPPHLFENAAIFYLPFALVVAGVVLCFVWSGKREFNRHLGLNIAACERLPFVPRRALTSGPDVLRYHAGNGGCGNRCITLLAVLGLSGGHATLTARVVNWLRRGVPHVYPGLYRIRIVS